MICTFKMCLLLNGYNFDTNVNEVKCKAVEVKLTRTNQD